MIIVGLSGHARSGKGSVVQLSQILIQKGDTEVEVRQVSFATAVKETAIAQGWNGQKDEEGRTILQDTGMEKRKRNPNYWIEIALAKVAEIGLKSPKTKIIFIPDCRFLNEADAIKSIGGQIWRVERYNVDGTLYDNGLTFEQKAHPSETELDLYSFDLTIHSANMADLFDGVKKALAGLGLC